MADRVSLDLVDPDGNVVDSVLWDGESKWSPPAVEVYQGPMVHDLKFLDVSRPSTKFPSEPEPAFYWWCVCGFYRDHSVKVSQTEAVEGFFRHLERSTQEVLPVTPVRFRKPRSA